MKRSSLRTKTIIYLVMALLFAFMVGLTICAIFSNNYYKRLKQKSLDTLNQQLQELDFRKNDFRDISTFCELNSLSLLIVDPAGNHVYSYGNIRILSERLDEITFGRGRTKEEWQIVKTGNNHTIQQVLDQGGKVIYMEDWGYLDNGYSYVVRCSFEGVQKQASQSLLFFSIVCAIILILCGIAIYFIVTYYTKPLRVLADYAQELSTGDFDAHYEYKHLRMDEIGSLGESFNQIGEKLESVIGELKTSNMNLENELREKTQMEEQRKKYMSDVSHELKTPIALISGYAEGLKEGISDDPEDRAYYCDVIIDEAEKMNLLVKRLSTLNQLEEGKSAVQLERFDVIEVINGFLNTMSMIIADHDVKVYFDNSYKEYVWSDEFLFEEVLVNYFNNALNHVDENGIIRINVERMEHDKVRVTLYNSGNPIPEDEIDKIWGKFYKVDQARTREYGGSGLGLSIVKAIADSLHQECGAYNMQEGVSFWIELESASIHPGADEDPEPQKPEKRRVKLTDLPIWKSTAGKIIRDDGKPVISFGKKSKPDSKEKQTKTEAKEKQSKTDSKYKQSKADQKNKLSKTEQKDKQSERSEDASDQ